MVNSSPQTGPTNHHKHIKFEETTTTPTRASMNYSSFNEFRFRKSVEDALTSVEKVLEVNRKPHLAEDIDHSYENKYDLADSLTNCAIIAHANVFDGLGLSVDVLQSVDTSKPTTIRFQASDTCKFLKTVKVKVPISQSIEATEEVTTKSGIFYGSTTKSRISRSFKHVKEYHWEVGMSWELSLFSGSNTKKSKILRSRSSSTVIITQSDVPPVTENTTHLPADLSLTWFLKMVDTKALSSQFGIDKHNVNTKTPRRNNDIKDALNFAGSLQNWARSLQGHFESHVESCITCKHNPAKPHVGSALPGLNSISSDGIFCPLQLLMEESTKTKANKEQDREAPKSVLQSYFASGLSEQEESPLLSKNDLHQFLNEQLRTMKEAEEALQKSFPTEESMELLSISEATLVLLSQHIHHLVTMYEDGMDYIEAMLMNQLVAAIGKEVKAEDVDEFVKFHNSRLLCPAPQPFCHAIRRPHHYPEGLLSIESQAVGKTSTTEPIQTLVRQIDSEVPLEVPLNAATTLSLTGSISLHGWMQHRFGGDSNKKQHHLVARARQFSSLVLVVGTMVGANRLNPKEAIIVQNNDEVLIPLLLNELPTAKEFKDAIRSLSPEQQRFAEAFRGMQLESAVMGVCVIQIKPQLEALLGLPNDALTKEMKLTQDLLELFVEYQIPSDLLSYDSPQTSSVVAADVADQVSIVKRHVQSVMDVIDNTKRDQMTEKKAVADMHTMTTRERELSFSTKGIVKESDTITIGGYNPQAQITRASGFKKRNKVKLNFCFPGFGASCAGPECSWNSDIRLHAAPISSGQASGARSRRSRPASNQQKGKHDFELSRCQRQESVGRGFSENFFGNVDDDTMTTPSSQESSSLNADGPGKSVGGGGDASGADGSGVVVVDFTSIPKLLDTTMELHDTDNALRSTIIQIQEGTSWTRRRQENLLSKMKESKLSTTDIQSEKNKAFDLLDALSRSGCLPIASSELHVIVSVTHCFDKDVVGTVIQDNMNPIEKLEKSTLMVASAIHGVPARELIAHPTDQQRLADAFPTLIV